MDNDTDNLGRSLEERKLDEEIAARKRELDVKEREVAAREREVSGKERELQQSRWASPFVLALFAATVGLAGNVWVEHANNKWAKDTERFKSQSSLILEAIKTGNPDSACQNLLFFIQLGFINEGVGTIEQRCATAPIGPPSLPAQSGSNARAMGLLGIVVDDSGTPLPDAIIGAEIENSVIWTNGEHPPSSIGIGAKTNESGYFYIDAPKGPCNLTVQKSGYKTAHLVVNDLALPVKVVLQKQ
jgi:hypothetical protein